MTQTACKSMMAPSPPVIDTERLRLRPLEPGDMALFTAFLTGPRSRYIGGPMSEAGAHDYVAGLLGQWAITGYGAFAICARGTDVALGDVGLYRLGGYREDELGWGLWRIEAEGSGLAREAALALRAYAHQSLHLPTLVSYIAADNARSIALARRLGCRHDPAAHVPDRAGWDDIRVYRHPAPEAL